VTGPKSATRKKVKMKDRTGDQRGMNGSLKSDSKTERKRSRLHPTHLGR